MALVRAFSVTLALALMTMSALPLALASAVEYAFALVLALTFNFWFMLALVTGFCVILVYHRPASASNAPLALTLVRFFGAKRRRHVRGATKQCSAVCSGG